SGRPTDLAALGRVVAETLPDQLEAITVIALVDGAETARATYEPFAPPTREVPAQPTLVAAGGDQPAPPVLPDEVKRRLALAVFGELDNAGFRAVAFDLDRTGATVWVQPMRYRQPARNIGRAARIVANYLPRELERITVVLVEGEYEVGRVSLLR